MRMMKIATTDPKSLLTVPMLATSFYLLVAALRQFIPRSPTNSLTNDMPPFSQPLNDHRNLRDSGRIAHRTAQPQHLSTGNLPVVSNDLPHLVFQLLRLANVQWHLQLTTQKPQVLGQQFLIAVFPGPSLGHLRNQALHVLLVADQGVECGVGVVVAKVRLPLE